jgi:hypothetical protein
MMRLVLLVKKNSIVATLAALAVMVAVFCGGCKNKGGEVPLPDTQGSYLWEGEYQNPLIKYVGAKENFPPAAFPVDIDFTTLSGPEFDEVFADVMFLYADNYLGKTVRFIGQYFITFDDVDNQYKHFVVFDDPKGCCVRFIEFAWNDGRAPDNYPEKFAIIDVAGEFSSYFDKEAEWDFNYMKVNGIAVLGMGDSW